MQVIAWASIIYGLRPLKAGNCHPHAAARALGNSRNQWANLIATACSPCRSRQPRKHMLHERDRTSNACHARTSDCSPGVRHSNLISSSRHLTYFCIILYSTPTGLPGALNGLYTSMSKTTEAVTPMSFLTSLRQAFPQFAEMARSSGGMKGLTGGYAQQGWLLYHAQSRSILTKCLHVRRRRMLDSDDQCSQRCSWPSRTVGIRTSCFEEVHRAVYVGRDAPRVRSIICFAALVLTVIDVLWSNRLKCDEAPEEPPSVTVEKVLKVECNIGPTTNYMHSGIMDVSIFLFECCLCYSKNKHLSFFHRRWTESSRSIHLHWVATPCTQLIRGWLVCLRISRYIWFVSTGSEIF